MSKEGNRYMWVLVFFDLPVVEKLQRKQATQFRNFLLGDGYTMIQWSVYVRLCNGQESVEHHLNRLQKELPLNGNIRSMAVTDLQYSRMKLHLGKKNTNERKNAPKQLTFL